MHLFLSVHLQWEKTIPSAPSVTLSTFNEQELRLVTNLTKLRPVSSMTQQALTLWLVAIMLSLPAGK